MAKKTKKDTSTKKDKMSIKEDQEVEDQSVTNNSEKENPPEEEKETTGQSAEKEQEDEKKSEKEHSQEEKLQELQDRYLRLSAEFDNYRKRTLKEKAELTKSATADVLISILSVMDDFERGMDTINNAKSIDAIKEGMVLIDNKLKDFLKQNGVKEIDAKEEEFDTDLHEAVTKIPAPKEKLKGKVVDVIQKGYKLRDKVIRYAKVVIGE